MSRQMLSSTDMEKCAVHPHWPIEAYCKVDNTFGCSLCFLVGHRSCPNVVLFSYLSHTAESAEEFLDVRIAADRHEALGGEYKRAIEKCLSINNDCLTKTLEDVQQFRSTLLNVLDEIELEVSLGANTLKEENERKLKTLADQIQHYSIRVKQIMDFINEKKTCNEDKQLFIALKQNGRLVHDSVQRLQKLREELSFNTFSFESCHSIKEELNKFSQLSVRPTPVGTEGVQFAQTSQLPATACTSSSTVSILSPNNISSCTVRGMVELSSTQLILTDMENSCLKLIDIANNIIIERAVESKPHDISMIPEFRLAVTLPGATKIQMFTADEYLYPCESIRVPAGCCGLSCSGDMLIVSFYRPAHVQILDMTGNCIRMIQHDLSGNTLFLKPLYLTVRNDLIYVTDCDKDTLTCIDSNDVVQWVYQDEQLKGPLGVVSGNDRCLYVCSKNTHTIHVVSPDGLRLALIPQRQSGVECPRAICYSSFSQVLYVSSNSNEARHRNYIKRLDLH